MARRQGYRQRGAAAVEFAIIVPVLLLLVAGIIDFGRAFFTQIQLANAAREGARAAIASTLTSAQIQDRASASAEGLTLTFPVLQQCPLTGGTQAIVEVATKFDYIILGPIMNKTLGNGTLSSKAVMKCGG